jgi:hypothetical protein
MIAAAGHTNFELHTRVDNVAAIAFWVLGIRHQREQAIRPLGIVGFSERR